MITTKEDFRELFGLDLESELGAMLQDAGSNKATRFIKQVEGILDNTYCKANGYGLDIVEDELTEHQIKCYKKAVCYQIEYYIDNGAIHSYSGYDSTTNTLVPRKELEAIGISSETHKWMRRGGMANL